VSKFEDLAPDGNDWMVRELRALRAELEELRSARPGEATSVGSGGITIKDDGYFRMVDDTEKLVVYFGPDELGRQVIRLLREGGKYVLFTGYAGISQFWALTDLEGRVTFSDDAAAGKGMGRPWLPVPLSPVFIPSTPAVGAVGTWCIDSAQVVAEVGLWEGRASISHPWIQVSGLWGHASGSGTVTYRLKVNNKTVGTWTAAAGEVTNKGPYDIADHIGTDWAPVQLTVQQATGTGAVRCHVLGCYFTQTQ
jgi:hypothetical protein